MVGGWEATARVLRRVPAGSRRTEPRAGGSCRFCRDAFLLRLRLFPTSRHALAADSPLPDPARRTGVGRAPGSWAATVAGRMDRLRGGRGLHGYDRFPGVLAYFHRERRGLDPRDQAPFDGPFLPLASRLPVRLGPFHGGPLRHARPSLGTGRSRELHRPTSSSAPSSPRCSGPEVRRAATACGGNFLLSSATSLSRRISRAVSPTRGKGS
ncbi:MAG: hypothetical protein KatS3mg076_0205 [Candidatus Binatia bacterium]|nr:MAG: hypothetical protein KatS3mg076_0205 [Candidatus Binatia bacterium]